MSQPENKTQEWSNHRKKCADDNHCSFSCLKNDPCLRSNDGSCPACDGEDWCEFDGWKCAGCGRTIGAALPSQAALDSPRIDTSAEALASAWADLPEALRCHPGVKRLYRIATAGMNDIATTVPSGWVPVTERLPEVEYDEGGGVNCVLAFYRPERIADYLPNPQACNTVYLRENPDKFTHWMPIPPAPAPGASLVPIDRV